MESKCEKAQALELGLMQTEKKKQFRRVKVK